MLLPGGQVQVMLRAQKFFRLLLLAYPSEFRREYGPHMVQVFGDCYRAAERRPGSLGRGPFWLSTVLDLFRAVPREHLDRLGKENSIMNNMRRDVVAVLGSIGIIVIAFLLLSYGILAGIFEETLVRGYLMTEMIALGKPVWLAAIASIALQTSYHLYYGFAGALSISSVFIVFAIYFAFSRRLFPVILAHAFLDIFAMLYRVHH